MGTTTSNQIAPGMIISLDGKVYRVESCVKVSVSKGAAFFKTKLKNLLSDEVLEKNFQPTESVQDVSLEERQLEYLYLEGKDYLFLDIDKLEQVLVPASIVQDRINYLKEGIGVKAMFYGDTVFSMELAQFLELMVVRIEEGQSAAHLANATRIAVLETGARIEVPMFIEVGDVIKVDTHSNEYIQRV